MKRQSVLTVAVAATLAFASFQGCSDDSNSDDSVPPDDAVSSDGGADSGKLEDGFDGRGDVEPSDGGEVAEGDADGSTDSSGSNGCSGGDGAFEVTSVQGDISEGNEITVCGDQFGDVGPNIVLFDNMESGQAGEKVPKSAPVIGKWLNDGGIYTDDTARSGSQSMVVVDTDSTDGSGVGAMTGIENSGKARGMETFDEFFVSWAIRDLGDFPGNNSSSTDFSSDSSAKDIWVMFGDRGDNYDYSCSQGECDGNDIVLATHTGSGSFKTDGNETASNWWHGDFWQFEAWNSMSLHLRIDENAPYSRSEGTFEHLSADGGYYRETYNEQIMRDLDQIPPVWDRIKFGAWYRNAGDVRRVMDDLYAAVGDGAAARVEVANAAQIEDATKVAISTVDSWSDDRIEATVRLGNLELGTGDLYLFVVDADNERTPGFALSP